VAGFYYEKINRLKSFLRIKIKFIFFCLLLTSEKWKNVIFCSVLECIIISLLLIFFQQVRSLRIKWHPECALDAFWLIISFAVVVVNIHHASGNRTICIVQYYNTRTRVYICCCVILFIVHAYTENSICRMTLVTSKSVNFFQTLVIIENLKSRSIKSYRKSHRYILKKN
jgi:hypothetical protein